MRGLPPAGIGDRQSGVSPNAYRADQVFSAARRINDQEPRRFADRTVPQRDRNAKNFESANDIATAAEIPANNAISKDGKRRVSQTAAMFSNCGGMPLRTNRGNSRTSKGDLAPFIGW